MFELLVYVFENYLSAKTHADFSQMTSELEEAGFEHKEIEFAIDWFATLKIMSERLNNQILNNSNVASRIYSIKENEKISTEGIGFLVFLEQAKVLSSSEREIILDRAMAVEQNCLNLDELKWIVMMTLWHFGRENEYLFIEDALFSSKTAMIH